MQYTARLWPGLLRDEWRGRPYLLSPVLDMLMVGGGGLLALLLMALLIPYSIGGTSPVAANLLMTAGMAAFLINYPHFLSSYQLFYGNYRERLQHMQGNPEMWWRTVNAGVAVPIALLLIMCHATQEAARGSIEWARFCIDMMLFTVGWHYTKQAFGVFIMLSTLKKTFYTAWQRKILMWNAYAVWMASWVYLSYSTGFIPKSFTDGKAAIGGLKSHTFTLPDVIRVPVLCVAVALTLATVFALVSQWKKTGRRPSATALTGYLSMYYLLAFGAMLHPLWWMLIPMFHSLQYLLFVAAYKRGEFNTKLAGPQGMERQRAYKRLRNRVQEFFALSFLLGILGFAFLPFMFEGTTAHAYPHLLPTGLFTVYFVTFINVHHFFIDNVIWRRENKEVGQFLIGWRQPKPA